MLCTLQIDGLEYQKFSASLSIVAQPSTLASHLACVTVCQKVRTSRQADSRFCFKFKVAAPFSIEFQSCRIYFSRFGINGSRFLHRYIVGGKVCQTVCCIIDFACFDCMCSWRLVSSPWIAFHRAAVNIFCICILNICREVFQRPTMYLCIFCVQVRGICSIQQNPLQKVKHVVRIGNKCFNFASESWLLPSLTASAKNHLSVLSSITSPIKLPLFMTC